jgi:AcrR family transcriptional regulator
MPRGPNIDRESLKESILTISREIVVEDGFAALNVRSIAKRIGCSVGTIYNIFVNIDDLVLHINATTLDDIYVLMGKKAKKASSDINNIQLLGRIYISYSKENYNLWSMLFEHSLPKGDKLPKWYQEKIDKIFALISKVAEPIYNGDTKQSMLAATVLWAGLHGICSLALSGSLDSVKAQSADKLADSLVTNYLS